MMIFSSLKRFSAMATGDYSKIFSDIKIPVLPQMAIQLLDVMREPDARIEDVSRVIEGDPGFSSRVLKTVNSALYSLPAQVSSISRAVSILGFKKIENIAISYAVASSVADPCKKGFDMDAFWADSLYRALFAREVASLLGQEPEEAFAGALLQDIALPVLLTSWFDVYKTVYLKWHESGRRLCEIEREELSWTHAQAGAWVAKQWRLPDTLVVSIGLHTSTVEELADLGLERSVPAAVALSSLVFSSYFGEDVKIGPLIAQGGKLDISLATLRSVGNRCDELFESLAQCFNVRATSGPGLSKVLADFAGERD